MRRRRGFTLIEMLVVLVVLAILAGLGLLKYIDIRASARTASLADDVRNIHVASLAYFADFETWPPDAGTGAVPTGLATYLPGPLAGSLDRTHYVLDFQNVMVSGEPLVSVAITSTDSRVLAKFITTFGGRTPFYMNGGTLTYVIAGPGM